MESAMSETLLSSLTVENLRTLMQSVGYRVDTMTDRPNAPYLRSATGGVPFEVQFVNRMPGAADSFADAAFVIVFRVEGEVPLSLANDWNNMKRFGRLRLIQNMLVLDMDVSAVGGIAPDHLRANIAIWDQLVQDLLPYLRAALSKGTAMPQAVAANGQVAAAAERLASPS
jgi:Putative bacterial sensory transduction regulator